MLPGGSFHSEISCDKAKGAQASLRMVSDGAAGDLRTHFERYDSSSDMQKAIVVDSHLVRLGPCPADLKPGLMRRPDGTVIETGEASRLLDRARGEVP